jgi:hypothetical protein
MKSLKRLLWRNLRRCDDYLHTSAVLTLIQKFGLQPYQVVENFISERHVHFTDDVDVNPIAYAEQFIDPDPTKAQTPEELLSKARLILSTELGKDPLLRNHIRMVFRETAQVTVVPTERGIQKIEENHPYFVSIPSHNNACIHFRCRVSSIFSTNRSPTYPNRLNSCTFSQPKRNTWLQLICPFHQMSKPGSNAE